MWSFIEIPPVAWPVKAGQDFFIYSSDDHFVQRTCRWCVCTTRDGTAHSCKVWLIFNQSFDQLRPGMIFLFLALVAFWPWLPQLWMVLITPVKFSWNPTSSLTCEGRTSLMRTNGRIDTRQRQIQYVSQKFPA
jgi:hypothetical protein